MKRVSLQRELLARAPLHCARSALLHARLRWHHSPLVLPWRLLCPPQLAPARPSCGGSLLGIVPLRDQRFAQNEKSTRRENIDRSGVTPQTGTGAPGAVSATRRASSILPLSLFSLVSEQHVAFFQQELSRKGMLT